MPDDQIWLFHFPWRKPHKWAKYISFQMLTASFSARQLVARLTFGSSCSSRGVSRAWRTIDSSGGGRSYWLKKKKKLRGFLASRRLLQKSEEEADATTSLYHTVEWLSDHSGKKIKRCLWGIHQNKSSSKRPK